MEWISADERLPGNGQNVRSKDSDNREFNCIYNSGEFKVAGYVWDHSNANQWHEIKDAYDGKPNKW